MGTEDHAIELGHTGLMEAVGYTEVRVAFQEGTLGQREEAVSLSSLRQQATHLPQWSLTAVQK